MPLILSLKEGADFFVGSERFVVEEIIDPMHFKLCKASNGDLFDVSDARTTEIMPNVRVQAGDHPQSSMVRVAVEAPKEVLVLRGENKRHPPDNIRARA